MHDRLHVDGKHPRLGARTKMDTHNELALIIGGAENLTNPKRPALQDF